MEGKVFPSPRIAKLLQDRFIEARLHTDGDDEAVVERIEKLQTELAGTVALPTYVIQDPATKRVLVAPTSGLTSESTFQEYLESALEAKEQVGRLPAR
jgi:thiol:disulfide interchange protein DsbD